MIKGFKYHGSHYAYVSYYKDGSWQKGELTDSIDIHVSSLSTGIQYGQSAFEGLKAYRTQTQKIQLFRVNDNAKRLQNSCDRLLMPQVPVDMFVDAVKQVVKANHDLVPNFETKGSLYIRPFIMGVGDILGVKPADEYVFMIVVSPVGSYFTDGFTSIKLTTTPYDRSAPMGLGHVKSGANYIASLYPKKLAQSQGFDDCLYLDPKTHTKLDETGATNVIGIHKNGRFVTPQSETILPSITNHSLRWIAENMLELKVERRTITIEELDSFSEFGACGTAAILTPISHIRHGSVDYHFKDNKILEKLYQTLLNIQYGVIEDPNDWITVIDI